MKKKLKNNEKEISVSELAGLMMKQFEKVWWEFSEVKEILVAQRKDIHLLQLEISKIQDDLRAELNKINQILEINGIKII